MLALQRSDSAPYDEPKWKLYAPALVLLCSTSSIAIKVYMVIMLFSTSSTDSGNRTNTLVHKVNVSNWNHDIGN